MDSKVIIGIIAVAAGVYWFKFKQNIPKALFHNNIEFNLYKTAAANDKMETFYYRGSDTSEFQIKLPHKDTFHNAKLVFDSSVFFLKNTGYKVETTEDGFFVANSGIMIIYGASNYENKTECLMMHVARKTPSDTDVSISSYSDKLSQLASLKVF